MCRHLAYLGPPVTLRAAIIDPPLGLYRQAWAPRMMRGSGTMNIDGFGAGWYADGDPVPARYRNSGPIWADPSFADLTRVTRSGALLAAVIGLLDQAGVTGRFNFLLTDGRVIAATTAGHTLFYRQGHDQGADSVTVVSEPSDEDPAWTEVPDRSLVAATASDVKVSPLPVPPEVTADSAERVQHSSFPKGMAATTSPDGRNPSQ